MNLKELKTKWEHHLKENLNLLGKTKKTKIKELKKLNYYFKDLYINKEINFYIKKVSNSLEYQQNREILQKINYYENLISVNEKEKSNKWLWTAI